jgi:DNA-directed RNA polymerase specialized sigma24 family protein
VRGYAAFPSTRRSVVAAAASADPGVRSRALDALARVYWTPVFEYLQLRWRLPPEDAEDLTQGFFARALEKRWFDRYDPERARFRTFVRTCLDGFVSNERKAADRVKRGGGLERVDLDDADAAGVAPADASADPEEVFRREWVRGLFALAVADLRAECAAAGHEVRFALFERYDLDGGDPGAGDAARDDGVGPASGAAAGEPPRRPRYRDRAGAYGLTEPQVVSALSRARRRFREIVLERLREACGSDEEFRAEARALLGVEP